MDINRKKSTKVNPSANKHDHLRSEMTEEDLNHVFSEPNVVKFLSFPIEKVDAMKEERVEVQ